MAPCDLDEYIRSFARCLIRLSASILSLPSCGRRHYRGKRAARSPSAGLGISRLPTSATLTLSASSARAAKAVTNACSSGAAGPFLPGIQDPFDKAQDQIAPSRLSARFLIHGLLQLRLRGSERLCFLPKVRHEAAELVPRLRLCMRTEFCVLPELRHPRR
jgi:hypothetical protein